MNPRPLLLTLLACASTAAQEPAAPALDTDHFAARRRALMERLGEGVVFLRGLPGTGDNGTFYQDHDFYYLTGVSQADVALLLFPETGEEVLLVPPFNRFTAVWEGAGLAPGEEAARRTGFAEVGNSRARAILRRLDEALAADEDGSRPVLWTALAPAVGRTGTASSARSAVAARRNDPFDGRGTREQALRTMLRERYEGLEVRDVSRHVAALRGVKTPAEIAAIRRATDLACQGIAEAMKSTGPGMMEYQVAAVARYVFSRGGGGPDAYAAIVGGGPNGCILHYDALTRRLREDDLIVMDYAPTWRGYASDVTRTFPADGHFDDAQRKLVEDVYGVQQELIAAVGPGARLSELSRLCGRLLRDLGYRPDHGPSHHVGLAVHDMGGNVLEPGMVITVEPGAYLRDAGRGCRIEDVVLVTGDGCEVLSAGLPSRPDAIEELMAGPGLHQQPVGLPDSGR